MRDNKRIFIMKIRFLQFSLCLISIFVFLCLDAGAEELRADIAVESVNVFAGESFVVQVQVAGNGSPKKPDLSKVDGFDVEYQGGQRNNSTSIRIINGQVEKTINRGYVFSYRFVPKKEGTLVIPPISVHADGKTVNTSPVSINVQKTAEIDNFKLQLRLSKTECYVGEPLILTATWYLGSDVRGFNFSIPALANDAFFHCEDLEIDKESGKQYHPILVDGSRTVGEKGRGKYDGRDYATITYKKIMTPKKSGKVVIKPATVECDALVGYRKRQSPFGNDFFSDFFNDDFFGRSRKGIYRKVVVPSNSINLKILEVPEKGRPANFAGHLGVYKIEATADPVQVSVGDPITLRVKLSGPEYLAHIKLPFLYKQPKLNRDFKIPKERASGEISGKKKIFTQTLRARRPDVKAIPPVELSYFDTRTGRYSVAKTKPIPISVKAARVITALDAEGAAGPVSSGSEVETWSKGIGHKYGDPGALKNQYYDPLTLLKTPLWMCMSLLPPVLYFILLTGVIAVRRRNSDPAALRAKKAGTMLLKTLKDIRDAKESEHVYDLILDAFRAYLGDKLDMPSAALTYQDVSGILKEKKVDSRTIEDLNALFQQCEAGRYSGAKDLADSASIFKISMDIAKKLEQKL